MARPKFKLQKTYLFRILRPGRERNSPHVRRQMPLQMLLRLWLCSLLSAVPNVYKKQNHQRSAKLKQETKASPSRQKVVVAVIVCILSGAC